MSRYGYEPKHAGGYPSSQGEPAMNAPKWKHRPCPCGCGEMADECMSPRSGLNAFQITTATGCPCGATFAHGPHDDWDAVPIRANKGGQR